MTPSTVASVIQISLAFASLLERLHFQTVSQSLQRLLYICSHCKLGTKALQRVSPSDTSVVQAYTVFGTGCQWTLAGCTGKTLTLYWDKWVPSQCSQYLKELVVRQSFYVLFKSCQLSVGTNSEAKLEMPGRQYEWRLRVVITVVTRVVISLLLRTIALVLHLIPLALILLSLGSFLYKKLTHSFHLYSHPFSPSRSHGKFWIWLQVSQASYKSTFVSFFSPVR